MQEQMKTLKEKMNKSIDVLKDEFASIRAGRANPAVLDKISVDYYGVPTPIQQMAAISVPEPRMLQIQPWDASTLKPIEKAIQVADIGINPQNDGRVIRLAFPALTEERRRDIAKDISKLAENTKVAIRSIRRDGLEKFKAMKKNSEITEDDLKNCEKQVQDITDQFCKTVDELAKGKEKEILEL